MVDTPRTPDKALPWLAEALAGAERGDYVVPLSSGGTSLALPTQDPATIRGWAEGVGVGGAAAAIAGVKCEAPTTSGRRPRPRLAAVESAGAPAPKRTGAIVEATAAAPRSAPPIPWGAVPDSLADALLAARAGRAVLPVNPLTREPFRAYPLAEASVIPAAVHQMFMECAEGRPLVGIVSETREGFVLLSAHNREEILSPKASEKEIEDQRLRRFDAVPSFAEFMQTTHERPAGLVGNIVRERDFVMLYGKPYSGKSWLTVQLAVAASAGLPWIGFPTVSSRVGIVSREIEAGDLQERCRTILSRAGKAPDGLHVYAAVYPYIEGPVDLVEDHEALRRFCERCELKILVLDPLSRLHRTDENSEEKMKPILSSIDTLREKCGVAVVLVHHERKGSVGRYAENDLDVAAGTRSFGANPTVNIRIKELGEKIRRLTFYANHASDLEPVYLQPVEGGGFAVTAAPMAAKDRKAENKRRIQEEIEKRGSVTYADLEALGLGTRKTLQRYIGELKAEGAIDEKAVKGSAPMFQQASLGEE